MHFQLLHGTQITSAKLPAGVSFLGSGEDDPVQVTVLPPRGLSVAIDEGGWTVCSKVDVAVSGIPLAADVARKMVPGDVLQLPGDVVLMALEEGVEERRAQTLSLFRGWLGLGGPRPPDSPVLECLTGLDLRRLYPLGSDACVIGRGLEANLRVRDRSVSRVHAKVVLEGAAHVLHDAGAANPIGINGTTVSQPTPLKSGDVLSLGRSHIRYWKPAQPTSDPQEVASRSSQAPVRAGGVLAPLARGRARIWLGGGIVSLIVGALCAALGG